MNVVLTCYAKKGKGSFILEKEGRVIYKDIFNINKEDCTLKEYIFEPLIKGLRVARANVEHDDLLLICLQNNHMCEWLNGTKDYKGYSSYLDMVYDIIDSIDCRYLFSHTDVKKAKNIINEDVVKEKLSGIDSILSM